MPTMAHPLGSRRCKHRKANSVLVRGPDAAGDGSATPDLEIKDKVKKVDDQRARTQRVAIFLQPSLLHHG